MKKAGFSLVEIMLAASIIVIAMGALLMMNRSSNQITMDSYYEFLAVQIAQEPIEIFKATGYPACLNLENYLPDKVVTIENENYPDAARQFERVIRLDTSQLPLCLVTVEVYPKTSSGARAWLRSGKNSIVLKGVVPVVR